MITILLFLGLTIVLGYVWIKTLDQRDLVSMLVTCLLATFIVGFMLSVLLTIFK